MKDYKDLSTDKVVEFHVTFHKGLLVKLLKQKADYGCNGMQKYMKLMTTKTMGNMYLFNHKEQLKKYECVEDIITDYFPVRWKAYQSRKAHILAGLNAKYKMLSNKARYINELLEDTLDLRRKKKDEINKIMEDKEYDKENESYNYLIKLPMDSVSYENVEDLLNQKQETEKQIIILEKREIKEMWLEDLERLVA